jgi:Primase C terminal 2 (PriCT-2)/Bifunctional DNA primase/polymerase, N-terminal
MVSDDLSFMARYGARLADNGYAVIPIMPGTKKPGRYCRGRWVDYPAWTRHCCRATTEHEIEIWCGWPDAAVGIACGAVIGIDIDIAADAEAAIDMERLARTCLGDTPALRIGCAPKRLLVYRAEAPFAGLKRAPLEVLGVGRQFVAYGLHPATGRPYIWPEESLADLPLENLPVVDEQQAHAFLEQAYERVPEALRPKILAATPSPAAGERARVELCGTPDAVAAALAFVPNSDLDYDSWIRIGMALKGALGEDGRELFESWSAMSSKDVPDTTVRTWASLKPERIGVGTIYHHALAGGWEPPPELLLNGGILVNGRHPARTLLERLSSGEERHHRVLPSRGAIGSSRRCVGPRRRAPRSGRLHAAHRQAPAAIARARRQPLRPRRADGPQIPHRDQPAQQPLHRRRGRQWLR